MCVRNNLFRKYIQLCCTANLKFLVYIQCHILYIHISQKRISISEKKVRKTKGKTKGKYFGLLATTLSLQCPLLWFVQNALEGQGSAIKNSSVQYYLVTNIIRQRKEQAGAELCQAQWNLYPHFLGQKFVSNNFSLGLAQMGLVYFS